MPHTYAKAIFVSIVVAATSMPSLAFDRETASSIAKRKGLSGKAAERLVDTLSKSGAAQGAGATRWQATRQECLDRSRQSPLKGGVADKDSCGFSNMAKIPGSTSCIDRFEWPNIQCEPPVTWVSSKEASEICQAEGKRLCDADEWESSCSGRPVPPQYERRADNRSRDTTWAYGPERRSGVCAMGSKKSPECDKAMVSGKGAREACGTNAWPSGYFPECSTPDGVYDLHGNVAEHMSLPQSKEQSTKTGGAGATEMKGSWFAFPDTKKPVVHPDDCLWREPGWHRTRVDDPRSHSNYHLGFRCCANTPESGGRRMPPPFEKPDPHRAISKP